MSLFGLTGIPAVLLREAMKFCFVIPSCKNCRSLAVTGKINITQILIINLHHVPALASDLYFLVIRLENDWLARLHLQFWFLSHLTVLVFGISHSAWLRRASLCTQIISFSMSCLSLPLLCQLAVARSVSIGMCTGDWDKRESPDLFLLLSLPLLLSLLVFLFSFLYFLFTSGWWEPET